MEFDNTNRRSARSFLPTTAVLEMTYQCNHACIFCSCPWYATGGCFDEREELDTVSWKQLISTLCDMGIDNFAFTGGDPLLKDGIIEIIEFAASSTAEHVKTDEGRLVSSFGPPELFLLTNGKALNSDILALCKRHDINLSLSLPGLNTFKEHTQGGDPDNVLYWFEQAQRAGVTTTAGVTVTRKNIDELYETISSAFLAGADALLMNRFLPGGRGLKYAKELSLNKLQIVSMLDTAEEVLDISGRKGHVGTELPKCVFDATKYHRLEVGTRCSAAQSFFVVGPSGYIRVCNHSPIRLNHYQDVKALKTDPYWKKMVMKEYLPSSCYSCEEMCQCDGGCREAAHIVGGAIDSKDPILAEEMFD